MFVKKNSSVSSLAIIRLAALVVLALSLAACSEDEETNATQVVAKVDSTEITVHQLNAGLESFNRSAILDPGVAENIRLSVLRKLVDQQLFVAQAKVKEMERDPAVVQAIEQAKRQILAQAYARKLMAGIKAPDNKAIETYFDEHPEFFKNRKIYTMRTLALSKQGLDTEVIGALEKLDNLTKAEAYLKSQGILYQQKMVTSPAEDMPMGVVLNMVDAPAGQLFVLNMQSQVPVYDVVEAIDQPFMLEQARPLINQLLTNQANEKRVRGETERLRKSAIIVYKGEFSDLKPTTIDDVPVESIANDGASSENVSRGLSGLK